MSLGVKLDTLRGPGAPGEKLARVIFRGELSYFLPYIISVWLIEKLAGSMKNYGDLLGLGLGSLGCRSSHVGLTGHNDHPEGRDLKVHCRGRISTLRGIATFCLLE